MPLFILVEDKQGRISQLPDGVEAEPWNAETWDALDSAILSVFKGSEIITTRIVRGSYPMWDCAMIMNSPGLPFATTVVVLIFSDHAIRTGHFGILVMEERA